MIKAVHLHSREYTAVRYLSSSGLRSDPMNHTIRMSSHIRVRHALNCSAVAILDLIDVPGDSLVFIVMEEWSPQLVSDVPCTLRHFLSAIRQCIEVRAFPPSADPGVEICATTACGVYAYPPYGAS